MINADRRLTPLGHSLRFYQCGRLEPLPEKGRADQRDSASVSITIHIIGIPLTRWIRRQGTTWEMLCEWKPELRKWNESRQAIQQVMLQGFYAG
ncbi:MAG: hypothetical protein QM762_22020 [Chryseolinea sp.]